MSERLRAVLPTWVAVWVWVALAVGVCGRVLAVPPEKGSVLPIYLTAAERWIRGEPLYPIILIPGLDLFRNPPGVAALFVPLTFLPAKLAAIVWRLLCLAVYAHAVRRFVRHALPPLPPWRRCYLWLAAAVLALPAFNNAQLNLPVAASAVAGCAAAARGRWWQAAAWLAGCGWLKVYPLAVGLLACVVAPRQLAWRLAVALAVFAALPFVCQRPEYVSAQHREFVAEMGADDRAEAKLVRAPRDWTILPRVWFGVSAPRPVSLAMGLIAAGVFAELVRADRSKNRWVLPAVLGLGWTCLFGPATEHNTYALLAVPAGALIAFAPKLPRWACGCGWAGTGLLLVAILRAAFPSDAPLPLPGVSAVGGGLLLIAACGWWKVAARGGGGG